MNTIKQRAVNPEQKKHRIEQVLDAAEIRFESAPFSHIRLVDIASDIGLTKAAFYRYFRKKELLFLALYLRHVDKVSDDIERNLAQMDLVKAITLACEHNMIFCKLSGILHTVLEQHITAEEGAAFKHEVAIRMSTTIDKLLPTLALTKSEVMELFLMMHQIIIGAWVTCNPAPAIEEAISTHPELSVFNLSFSNMMEKHLALLFKPYLR